MQTQEQTSNQQEQESRPDEETLGSTNQDGEPGEPGGNEESALTDTEQGIDNELEDGPATGLDDEGDAGDQAAGSTSVTE